MLRCGTVFVLINNPPNMNFEKPLFEAWDKKDWLKLLIGLLILAAGVLWYRYSEKDLTGYTDNKKNSEKVESLIREKFALQMEMQRKVDSTQTVERAKTDAAKAETKLVEERFSAFKTEQMAKLEDRLNRVEAGDKRINRLAKTFSKETQETKKTSRELDSASKKLDL